MKIVKNLIFVHFQHANSAPKFSTTFQPLLSKTIYDNYIYIREQNELNTALHAKAYENDILSQISIS